LVLLSVLVWLPPPAIALAAPATAAGLSRPVMVESGLPFGWGSKLDRLVVARDDAARFLTGVSLREAVSLGTGCTEERRLEEERADIDVCAVRWRGRTDGDDWRPVPGPRDDRRETEFRRGELVSPGDANLPAPSDGDLRGIFDSDFEPAGLVRRERGLGVVSLGLKL
jgi:hypothetical protein